LIAPPLPMKDFMAMLQQHMNKGRAPKESSKEPSKEPSISVPAAESPPAAASA
jgi:hypothetical protein